ncbi:MAG: lactate racemase domain-containing protein [Bacteroidales bacterium]|jgi:nickel-dependent lactate racemase|nr:lactate racemase domain-containing protein [Bacteroidales bacterium]
MLYYSKGSKDYKFSNEELKNALSEIFGKLGKRSKVLALPPDFTRFHSFAGTITEMTWEHYGDALTEVLPALGTHAAMSDGEIDRMFGKVPHQLFRVHDWRNDIVTVGTVPPEYIRKVSEGKLNYPWPAQVNKLLANGGHDLILSIGQVVPHEVIGMANYNKNIFVGTGGAEGINKSHFIGAVYGMERIMGRAESPVRSVLNYASEHFTRHLPIVYIQTVVSKDESGKLQIRGLYAGDDFECFRLASELSLETNFLMVEKPIKKAVVWLDPAEFKSTWLGNKSIYRTRMALADGAELIVLAPGLKEFGEDKEIDRLIRKYGYAGTPKTLEAVDNNKELQNNLGAAAHLIHGSSEGRFTVTYCPGHLTREETESVHFHYAPLDEMLQRYNPQKLTDGFNTLPDGEEVFYISNPALGLWAHRDRFNSN